ncbi:unnamed protein product [Blepharisma stoltei]|uniref:carbonic anhydrase n=1 Tax=Blepharisma stoltei TaxID=1481888 RepID=A0AAU9JM04_9CILI|nr:unnamed protein product [Blepharisma stoltei]
MSVIKTIMLLFEFLCLLSIASAENYINSGKDWEGLCKTGHIQSPINLKSSDADFIEKDSAISSSLSLEFLLAASTGLFTNTSYQLLGNFGGVILGTGKNDEIKLFSTKIELHSPSEHYIQDKQFDLEMQIFLSDGETDEFSYILSVFYQESNQTSKFLKDVIESEGKTLKIDVGNAFESIEKIYNFYFYEGSYTVPPCTEDIGWLIWPQIQKMDKPQHDFFSSQWQNNTDFAEGNGNNREIQAPGSRIIIYFDGVDKLSSTSLLFLLPSSFYFMLYF